MDRIQRLTRTVLNNPLDTLFRAVAEIRRIHVDASRLNTLPRDRLEDMGITPLTDDNQRHSGQRGRVPPSQTW